jgi:hypothetical protein
MISYLKVNTLMAHENSGTSAVERAAIFHEQYGNDVDAGAALAGIVTAAGDYLARIIGPDVVDRAMAQMTSGVIEVAGESVTHPNEWRDALSRAAHNCYSEWPLGVRLHDLAAYAVYGIVLDGSEDQDARAQALGRAITEAEEFLASTPITQWHLSEKNDLVRLIRLARNRWALDNGRGVEPAALAEFGGVSEGHIRNLMSGQKRAFTPVDGLIPSGEALSWLSGRTEFWNSVWRDEAVPQYSRKDDAPVEDPTFVPVARDGSIFHPGLFRGVGYSVGEKGAEVQIGDFDEALAALQKMPTPYWRRPNESGNWGIVAGVRWLRVNFDDLTVIAKDPHYRVPTDDRS